MPDVTVTLSTEQVQQTVPLEIVRSTEKTNVKLRRITLKIQIFLLLEQ